MSVDPSTGICRPILTPTLHGPWRRTREVRPLGRGKRAGAGGQVGRGNAVGVDPHKHTLTASVIDERGGELGTRSFRVSGVGHRDMEAWAVSFGAVVRWGVEGAGGLGRHTAMYLVGRGHDVRDVCPTRTAERARRRRQGKTDALDSVRIARETQADPDIAVAFKRAGPDAALDTNAEVMGLWHGARRSILKSRQHLLNESEALLVALPRCEPRARKVFDDARHRGHTKKEAMRILTRHLSDVVYRRMVRDLKPDHEVSAEAA